MTLYEDKAPFLAGDLDTQGKTIGNSGQVLPLSGSSVTINGWTWPAADGTSGQVLQTNGSKTLSFTTPIRRVFYAYSTATSSLNTAGTVTAVTLNTEVKKDSGFTHTANSANVTIATAGWYRVTAQVAGEIGAAAESIIVAEIEKDTGAGFTALTDGRGFGGAHDDVEKDAQATIDLYHEFAADDVVRVVAWRVGAAVTLIANQSRLILESI